MVEFAKKLHQWLSARLGRMLNYEVDEDAVAELEAMIAREPAPDRSETKYLEKNVAVAAWDAILAFDSWAEDLRTLRAMGGGMKPDARVLEELNAAYDQLDAALAGPVREVRKSYWDFHDEGLNDNAAAKAMGWKIPHPDASMPPLGDVSKALAEKAKGRGSRDLIYAVVQTDYRVSLVHRYVETCQAWEKRAPAPVVQKVREALTIEDLDRAICDAERDGGTVRWVSQRFSKGQFSEGEVIERAEFLGKRLKDMPVALTARNRMPTDEETQREAEERMYVLAGIPVDWTMSDADRCVWLNREHGLSPNDIAKVYRIHQKPITVPEVAKHLAAAEEAEKKGGKKREKVEA